MRPAVLLIRCAERNHCRGRDPHSGGRRRARRPPRRAVLADGDTGTQCRTSNSPRMATHLPLLAPYGNSRPTHALADRDTGLASGVSRLEHATTPSGGHQPVSRARAAQSRRRAPRLGEARRRHPSLPRETDAAERTSRRQERGKRLDASNAQRPKSAVDTGACLDALLLTLYYVVLTPQASPSQTSPKLAPFWQAELVLLYGAVLARTPSSLAHGTRARPRTCPLWQLPSYSPPKLAPYGRHVDAVRGAGPS